MSKVSYYTEEGLKKLREELNKLKDIERPKASQAIAEARDKGDLSENAEYDAAKEAQGLLELRISKLEETLSNARIINESDIDHSKVLILSTVVVKNLSNNSTMTYTLVAESEADLAKGLMSINAVKGFEIGKGFGLIASKGSDARDEMSPDGYLSNNSGGISGGISTGQDINLSIALKPTSSINKEGKTIDSSGESQEIQVKGRHDPCVGVRATPIAEAMTALVIMDHFLRNRAQNADVVTDIPDYS